MKFLLLPGDGIGPEIMEATEQVLAALDRRYGLAVSTETAEIGETALARTGTTVPDGLIARARTFDAVLLGPVDTAAYPPASEGGFNPSAAFRRELDLYPNVRPSRSRTKLIQLGLPRRGCRAQLLCAPRLCLRLRQTTHQVT